MESDGLWTIATAEDDGKPLIFRIRNPAPPVSQQEDHPHLLAVTWKYESPNDQGMPSPKVAKRMTELEHLLHRGLADAGQAVLTVAVTGNGVREWQWYVRDPETTMELVNGTLGHLEPFPVQFMFQDDPGWEAYHRLRDSMESEA